MIRDQTPTATAIGLASISAIRQCDARATGDQRLRKCHINIQPGSVYHVFSEFIIIAIDNGSQSPAIAMVSIRDYS